MEASTGPLTTTHPFKESQLLQLPLEWYQAVGKQGLHLEFKGLWPTSNLILQILDSQSCTRRPTR